MKNILDNEGWMIAMAILALVSVFLMAIAVATDMLFAFGIPSLICSFTAATYMFLSSRRHTVKKD